MNDMTTAIASDTPAGGAVAMMFDQNAMSALMAFGNMMAESRVTIPEHFRGKPADCTAMAMQAALWGMNPFAVAQKTHITQGGALGYEAQLVNAAIVNSGKLTTRPEFVFLGDWSKILGKVEERKSDKPGGGKYYVATYTRADEVGLGVICRATLAGESEPREITVMMSQAWPRFSTQWATDPQQQITYLAVRKFARRYTPDVILGVATTDEIQAEVIDMGAAEEVPPPAAGPQRKSTRAAPKDVTDVTPPAPPAEGHAPAPEQAPAPAAAPATAAMTAEKQAAARASVTTGAPRPDPADEKGRAPATGSAKINTNQVAYLRAKLTQTSTEEATILSRFNVADLGGLTPEQFDALKSELLSML